MQSLLRWSVENSAPSTGPPPTTTNKLDPGIIDHILGKPDAQLMREALIIGVDERQTEDDRLQALDDLEMLVQNIDNANDLEKLGLWQPLHNLLQSPNTTDTLKMQTLWIIGTALQNNPAAQLAYLNLDPLPTLLKSLSPTPSNSAETRSRALYALSGFLKLNAAAVQQMGAVGGWSALRMCLEDSEIRVRRKTTFLLNTLLLPTSSSQVNLQPNINLPTSETAPPQIHANSHASMLSDPSSVSTSALTLAAIQEEGEEVSLSLLDALISALVEPVPFGVDGEVEKDEEFQENVVRILYTFATSCNGAFSDVQKRSLSGFLGGITTTQGEESNFGLTSGELEELNVSVRS